MPTIIGQLDRIFTRAILDAFGMDWPAQLGISQNPQFGDYQSNAAMGLAKPLSDKLGKKIPPRQIAGQIVEKLELGPIGAASIDGPGFINVKLSPAWLSRQLNDIQNDPVLGQVLGPVLGLEKTTQPMTIVVDYSGPNIAKEMHVGHLRSTIIGDAICRLLEFQGHKIIRQNHLGDWGTQFGMLIAYLDATGLMAGGDKHIQDLEDFYRAAKTRFDQDASFAAAARNNVVRLQSGDPAVLSAWKRIVDETLLHLQPIYDQLGVKPIERRGESFYNPMLAQIVTELKQSGIALESQGAIVVEAPGFHSPLIIQKSDGGYPYGSTDLAAIRFRVQELHAQRIIYVIDARQHQHLAQVFWTAEKAGWATKEMLDHVAFGTMLGEDNKPFKTRSGDLIKLKSLLDEAQARAMKVVEEKNAGLDETQKNAIAHAVGIGAVKYADLSKDRISDYMFSFDKMLSLDGNTAPYLQYAHARIRSIFRKAAGAAAGSIALESPFEIALGKHILRLGEILDLCTRELKPHHLCTYLYELATRFSGFYENCPVLQSDDPTRASRLGLCSVAAKTMELGLDLLGIEHPPQM